MMYILVDTHVNTAVPVTLENFDLVVIPCCYGGVCGRKPKFV